MAWPGRPVGVGRALVAAPTDVLTQPPPDLQICVIGAATEQRPVTSIAIVADGPVAGGSLAVVRFDAIPGIDDDLTERLLATVLADMPSPDWHTLEQIGQIPRASFYPAPPDLPAIVAEAGDKAPPPTTVLDVPIRHDDVVCSSCPWWCGNNDSRPPRSPIEP